MRSLSVPNLIHYHIRIIQHIDGDSRKKIIHEITKLSMDNLYSICMCIVHAFEIVFLQNEIGRFSIN